MTSGGNPHTPPHSATSIYGGHRSAAGGPKFTFPEINLTLNFPEQQQQMPGGSGQSQQQQAAAMANASLNSKVTSPNPRIDSVKSYDSDKTLSGEVLLFSGGE